MGIPELQLETWSHQGSITQSSATYNTIKSALEVAGSPYAGKDYNVFLQGSYGNLISDIPQQAHVVSHRGVKMVSPIAEVSHGDEPSAVSTRTFDD